MTREVAPMEVTTSAVVVPDDFVFAHGNSSGVVGYWRTMDWDLVSLYLQSRRQGGVGPICGIIKRATSMGNMFDIL